MKRLLSLIRDQYAPLLAGRKQIALVGPVNSGKSSLYNALIVPSAPKAQISRLVAAVERGGSLESLLDGLKAKETERRRLRQDLLLLDAAIGSRRATFLDAREIAEMLGELRQRRAAEDTQELRAVLKMIIERIVVDGEAVTVHYRPEAEPWFRTP